MPPPHMLTQEASILWSKHPWVVGSKAYRLQRLKKVLSTHQVQGVGFLCLPLPALLGSDAIFLPSLNFPDIIG